MKHFPTEAEFMEQIRELGADMPDDRKDIAQMISHVMLFSMEPKMLPEETQANIAAISLKIGLFVILYLLTAKMTGCAKQQGLSPDDTMLEDGEERLPL